MCRYATLLSSHEQQAALLEQQGTEKMEADLTALHEKMESAAQREALEQQVLALSEREALLSAQRQADQQVSHRISPAQSTNPLTDAPIHTFRGARRSPS